jgi:ornithine cyclodeaminase/alanine dehydrogenase-like protein (mu-crystallin family)
MKKIDFLFLSQEDVLAVGLSMPDIIETIEVVFQEHGSKRYENPPKPGVHPRGDAFIHAMPGYLPALKAAGLKWVSSYPSNQKLGLPAVMGVMILNDVDTGQPLALLDCRWITAVRTAAVSAVAAKYLANPVSAEIGIVGAGTQGRYNLVAIKEVLPALKRVRVFDTSPKMLDGFVNVMVEQTSLEIQPVTNPEAAIRGADVVVTATGKLDQPVYQERWVKPGSLVLPVHHRGWENDFLHRADKFVCDDWLQLQNAHKEVGGFYGPLPPLSAELGEIVQGLKAGRQHESERIVDFNYGLAIEDVALAACIYQRAVAKGLGSLLTLSQAEIPFL